MRLAVLACVLGFAISAAAQTPAPIAKPQLTALLAQLHSANWQDRAAAYERLRSDPAVVKDVTVQAALLDLLDRENRLIESTNRDEHGPSVEEKYGEGFADYVADLGETVDAFADWNDLHQVCIFVHEAYDPESRFAAEIASHAKLAIPCLIEMYGSDVGLIRAEAVPVLVQALARGSSEVDAKTLERAKQIILQALHDPDSAVLIFTARALGSFGGSDMIPALEQVAATAPNDIEARWARDAIAAIQKRTSQVENAQ